MRNTARKPAHPPPPPRFAIPPARSRGRWLLVVFFGVLIAGGLLLGREFADLARDYAASASDTHVWTIIVMVLIVYIVVAAVPFVPAAEIGLSLMMIAGPESAVLVYLGTVIALTMGYLAGRIVPAKVCATVFAFFGFRKARTLILEMAALDAKARADLLLARAPKRIVPALLRHRYLALALALSLPGNTVIGGGGGIAMSAGMSGLYPMPAYLLTVAFAVAPVPVLFMLSQRLPWP